MNPITHPLGLEPQPWPISPEDIPIIYEDEEENDMGQSFLHMVTIHILFACLEAHLRARWPKLRVFADMNCYYLEGPPHERTGSKPYISADIMIVEPYRPLPRSQVSYTIDKDGPVPRVVIEVLSPGTADRRDLEEKVTIYRKLQVREYILVDLSEKLLADMSLLKRLQPNGTWMDEYPDNQDGVTSELGFRLIIDEESNLAVVDVETGKRYLRPDEAEETSVALHESEERAEMEAEARRQAEDRLKQLQEELDRLRRSPKQEQS